EDVGAGDDLDEVALRARSADLLLEERGEPFRLREEAALDPLEPRAALVQAEPGPCGLGTARAVHQTRDLVERRDGYGRKGRTVPRAHAADRAVDHRGRGRRDDRRGERAPVLLGRIGLHGGEPTRAATGPK